MLKNLDLNQVNKNNYLKVEIQKKNQTSKIIYLYIFSLKIKNNKSIK